MNYADNTYHFRQDSTFLYYFGLNQASLNGVIDADSGESILFGDELTVEMIVWTGVLPSLASLSEKVGLGAVKTSSELPGFIADAMNKGRSIHFLAPYRADIVLKISGWLNIKPQAISDSFSLELTRAVVSQREIKSEEELAELDKAV
jgi:Xaa-Pro aminopeptidase